jgi:hypothetical protein
MSAHDLWNSDKAKAFKPEDQHRRKRRIKELD